MFQLYYHKDKGLTHSMIDRCREADFDAMTLTVDTIVGGNRERDLVTGFTSPPRLTPASIASFALHPSWTFNYLFRDAFELSNLKSHVAEGSNVSVSISDYFSTMLDQSMDWEAAAEVGRRWGGQYCLKGVMSVDDARRAVDIGATAIMISNHGGRQLDGSRAPFDQLAEIVDAVGDKIDVICDGGIQRGTHVLKALSLGAKACSGGRWYLYALAAAGQAGVERALLNMRTEIERDMKTDGRPIGPQISIATTCVFATSVQTARNQRNDPVQTPRRHRRRKLRRPGCRIQAVLRLRRYRRRLEHQFRVDTKHSRDTFGGQESRCRYAVPAVRHNPIWP